ncbi:MAG: DNA-directed RNA polymerase subunit beta' [Omnitrophica WOR_2 bacterium RIFCSPHIGHO2_02_FULL_67_20]|nr:MAG: DNA-directed RNA polymerase subunit beta' [Omnitrophica WOR_2 bacterium RIFCSPHIGHO2_02_FULL_67_20]
MSTPAPTLMFDDVNVFDAITIRVASPEIIRSWSKGEVKKPETINYRTLKPEKDGLFCERIFGPTKDFECNCGKYRKIKHKGITCDRCGVEVTHSKVRRERMGHIELAAPVSHIWFFKSVPSRVGALLDMTMRELERVLYYEAFVVTDPGSTTPLKLREILTEDRYQEALKTYGKTFTAKMGAEAVHDLLATIDLGHMARLLHKELQKQKVEQTQKRIARNLRIIEAFRKSGNRPEWMILKTIPVIPPDLRPLVPLDGGRFATSDLNDLYRRVINRNNRLKKLIELKAPEIIIRNEKRMLQEAVDALFDNGRHGRPVLGPMNRPLKSLADMLKGKQGRFRQNLLGKRVDYSGRSVIVIGPELKLHQCGLPKKMALELFEPFIIRKFREQGFAQTIKTAKRMVEKERTEVWDILDEVIKDHPVLLNRAPTLHRLGIQAFQPQLIEGKAIRVHPLVCTAFNADFDGDQMAVHVPLSIEAQLEARILMLASNNLFSPASGKPIVTPTQDIILGCYYLTKSREGLKGQGLIFSDLEEAVLAYQDEQAALHAKIKLRWEGQIIETTPGRVLFNLVLPEEVRFVNELIDKGRLSNLISKVYRVCGHARTVHLLDALKTLGFEWATLAGMSIGIIDLVIPPDKDKILARADKEVEQVEGQYRRGLITEGERSNKIIDIWMRTTEEVSDHVMENFDAFNPLFMMADSGARGSEQQVRQLAGMRGLMAKPSGDIIESPIKANFREGLTVHEYFISTHGARKGLADTALKTADSGYLTRRLVDVAQEVIITQVDCGTLNGILMTPIREGDEDIVALKERIIGRVALDNIVDVVSDEVLVRAGEEITEDVAERIEQAGIEKIRIRSVLTCEAERGTCAKCYGRNLATGWVAELGEAVGVIAAQSIGEPGTQLTMRTFHIGGTAHRVVEQSQIKTKHKGTVKFHNLKTVKTKPEELLVLNRNGELSLVDPEGRELERHRISQGAVLAKGDGEPVAKDELLVRWDPYTTPILTEYGGIVRFEDVRSGITMREEMDEATGLTNRIIVEHKGDFHPQVVMETEKGEMLAAYGLPIGAHVLVKEGQTLKTGDMVAKTARKISQTKDITGGLPRIAELFEARRPKDPAIIAEIDGIVDFGTAKKGQRRIIIKSASGMTKEYLIPHGKHLNVYKGDYVQSGAPLTDGPIVPQDILRVIGERGLQEYLVNEIQEVYRSQGVKINDKHVEVIVRQMLRKIRIDEPGDTEFLIGMQIDKAKFAQENERVKEKGGKPAQGTPILLGITKASLSTESFIAAASFQETTRVLTEAAASGKRDGLVGLKENVIMGHLIPAGTGFSTNRIGEMQKVAPEVLPLEPQPEDDAGGATTNGETL